MKQTLMKKSGRHGWIFLFFFNLACIGRSLELAARKDTWFRCSRMCPIGSIEGRMIQRMDGRYGLQQDDFSRIHALQLLYS